MNAARGHESFEHPHEQLDVEPARAPGRVPVTARLAPAPQATVTQYIFRASDPAAASALSFESCLGTDLCGAEAAVDRAASTSGAPLPADVQSRFESSLGADLSSVRVHTGAASADAASAVGARAYTVGTDIHFSEGRFDPSSDEGLRLLAHEVAHTVQQGGATPTRQHKLEVSSSQDHAEVEADQAAAAMVAGQTFALGSAAAGVLHRKDDETSNGWEAGSYTSLAAPGAEGSEGEPKKVRTWVSVVSDKNTFDPKTHPYLADPHNWGATAPAEAATTTPFAPGYKYKSGVMGNRNLSGEASGWEFNQPEVESAHTLAAQQAFTGAMQELAATTAGLYPQKQAYDTAGTQLGGNSELTKLMGWEATSGKQDMGSVVMDQQGSGVKTEDVFSPVMVKDVGNEAKVDVSGATQTKEVKDAVTVLNGVIEKVKLARAEYDAAVEDEKIEGDRVANAAGRIKVTELAGDIANKQAEVKAAEAEKARIVTDIQNATKSIGFGVSVAKFASNPADNWDSGVAGMLTVYEAVATAVETREVDQKIEKLNGLIEGAQGRMSKMKVELDMAEYDTAKRGAANAKTKVTNARTALKLAGADLQNAYNVFSKAAGAAAGGDASNQARVEAAIRAIPKVQEVVSALGKLRVACTLPAYSADAGRGYNASLDQAQFSLHYGNVKALTAKYAGELKTWTARLTSLQKVAGAFGGPGPAPSNFVEK